MISAMICPTKVADLPRLWDGSPNQSQDSPLLEPELDKKWLGLDSSSWIIHSPYLILIRQGLDRSIDIFWIWIESTVSDNVILFLLIAGSNWHHNGSIRKDLLRFPGQVGTGLCWTDPSYGIWIWIGIAASWIISWIQSLEVLWVPDCGWWSHCPYRNIVIPIVGFRGINSPWICRRSIGIRWRYVLLKSREIKLIPTLGILDNNLPCVHYGRLLRRHS